MCKNTKSRRRFGEQYKIIKNSNEIQYLEYGEQVGKTKHTYELWVIVKQIMDTWYSKYNFRGWLETHMNGEHNGDDNHVRFVCVKCDLSEGAGQSHKNVHYRTNVKFDRYRVRVAFPG